MAIDNLPNGSDESRLSGAYIRTLVKQLTTSKSTNTTENFISNDNSSCIIVDDYKQSIPLTSKKGDKLGMAKSNNQQNVQQGAHKKQVRRRLHTSRPYQERLLNMAEARKEIVTALKFHRAAMKQANEQRKQQQLDGLQHHRSIFGGHDYENSNVKHEIINNSELVENFNYYPSNNININSSSYSWSGVTSPNLVEPPPIYENIPLPNQTLGLNLNLQAFTNLDANLCHSINTSTNNNTSSNFNYNNSFSSSLSPSTSSSSTPRDPRGVETMATEVVGPTCEMHNDMHPSLDEEEMAEIRSLGEQHQIEWDDTLNLVKSVWWFKFLKTVDIGKEMKGGEDSYYSGNYNNAHPFGELMDFPPWLSANNDQSFLQQHLDDSCTEETTLPWMDIGDIDGLDDDWLS